MQNPFFARTAGCSGTGPLENGGMTQGVFSPLLQVTLSERARVFLSKLPLAGRSLDGFTYKFKVFDINGVDTKPSERIMGQRPNRPNRLANGIAEAQETQHCAEREGGSDERSEAATTREEHQWRPHGKTAANGP